MSGANSGTGGARRTRSGGSTGPGRRRGHVPDGRQEHQDWLSLIDVSGPFLSLPVLLQTWPNLDALDAEVRGRLRAVHAQWLADPKTAQDAWIDFVLRELLDWHDELRTDPGELLGLRMEVPQHTTHVDASFVLVDPGARGDHVEPARDGEAENGGNSSESKTIEAPGIRLLGLTFPPETLPTARIKGEEWSATPIDRLAQLCRHHGVQLGMVTDGRWWALVRAPRNGVTTYAVFDAITWPEVADRTVVRAFISLLRRKRFFVVDEGERLLALLDKSATQGEDVTEQLGVQVRRAVELLVDAIGRSEARLKAEQGRGFADAGISAHDVYRGAVAVMMRIVFLLFAEDTELLPSDNDLYAATYSVARLCEQLEDRVREAQGLEEELEHSTSAWHRLLALFRAVHGGVDHPELQLPAYDGSIFDPDAYPWLEGRLDAADPSNTAFDMAQSRVIAPLAIDDRTVYHMLLAVQYVVIGTGKAKERRKLTFRTLDVEQIGYVYEGLLAFEGFRAADTVVGLIGKAGFEEEVELAELEALARPFWQGSGTGSAGGLDVEGFAAKLAEKYKDSGIGTAKALAKRLEPMSEVERKTAVLRLHASTADPALVERLLPFAGIVRSDLRDLPVVIKAGALYVTESKLRKNTGTHYTPRFLAEQVAEGALEPLVYEPGPLQTADQSAWVLKRADDILALKVADIAMGSAAFLVAACRYLAARLVEAWARDGKAGDDGEKDLTRARRVIIEHCLYGVDINPMAVEMAKLSLWLVSMDTSKPFTFLDDRLVAGDSLLGITRLEQLEFMHLNPDTRQAKRYDQTRGMRALVNDLIVKRDCITRLSGDTIEQLADKRRLLNEVTEQTKTAKVYADLVVGAALSSAGKSAKAQDKAYGSAQFSLTVAVDSAEKTAQAWLATDRPDGAFDREPVHWPLEFPEVFAKGGFDAVIGNPPFFGGKKITGALGDSYREHLVAQLGHGVRGNADLVAYFVLRAYDLLNPEGGLGLIATNTLAQGDTREVGLDQIVADGSEIRIAVKSEPWPARSAVLQYHCPKVKAGQSAVGRFDSTIVIV